jgi:hypothetical protein
MMRRVRRAFACAAAALASSAALAADDYTPSGGLERLSARVCVERQREPGWVDAVEAHVLVSVPQRLVLVGGQAACVLVPPGELAVEATAFDVVPPGQIAGRRWQSERLRLSVRRGETVVLDVRSNADGTREPTGWILRELPAPGE